MTVVSSRLSASPTSKGNVWSGAPNERGVGKIGISQLISYRRPMSETVQDRTKVSAITGSRIRAFEYCTKIIDLG